MALNLKKKKKRPCETQSIKLLQTPSHCTRHMVTEKKKSPINASLTPLFPSVQQPILIVVITIIINYWIWIISDHSINQSVGKIVLQSIEPTIRLIRCTTHDFKLFFLIKSHVSHKINLMLGISPTWLKLGRVPGWILTLSSLTIFTKWGHHQLTEVTIMSTVLTSLMDISPSGLWPLDWTVRIECYTS